MYFVFLISFGCLSMFSHSSLNFFKTIILNSLSGSKISISLVQLLGFYFSSFGSVKFPLILCDTCGLVLVSMHLKKEHFFQSLQGKAFTSQPSQRFWVGWLMGSTSVQGSAAKSLAHFSLPSSMRDLWAKGISLSIVL